MDSTNVQNGNSSESEIKIPKKRLSYGPDFLKQNWCNGSQIVDPKFNELHLKFNYVASNLEALLHSCETYKLSMQSFFYHAMSVTESFRQLLEGVTHASQVFPPSQHSVRMDIKSRTYDILKQFYLSAGITDTEDQNKIDIQRLNKQLCVVSKRVEADMVFFENSVQKPINFLIQICSNISRTISSREIANLELSGVYDKVVKEQQSPVKSPNAGKGTLRNKLARKLAAAKSKYDTLNAILKTDLEKFLMNICTEFMKEWFKNYYYTTLRISYSLHYFCWNCPEFKKLGFNKYPENCAHYSDKKKASPQEAEIAMAAIMKSFHHEHHYVSQEIDKLRIANSRCGT